MQIQLVQPISRVRFDRITSTLIFLRGFDPLSQRLGWNDKRVKHRSHQPPIPETCYFDHLEHTDSFFLLFLRCCFFPVVPPSRHQNYKTSFLCDNQKCQLHLAQCHTTRPTSIVKGLDPDSVANRRREKNNTTFPRCVNHLLFFPFLCSQRTTCSTFRHLFKHLAHELLLN